MSRDVTGMDEVNAYLSDYTMDLLERIATALERIADTVDPPIIEGPQG